jgi:hypothetical protein
LDGEASHSQRGGIAKEKKMKLLSIVLIIIVLATGGTVISCSCGGGGSPSGVVKVYYTAANAGDIDEAMEYVDIGSILAPGEMDLRGLDGGIEKIEIVDEQRGKEFGVEMASVTVKVYYTPKGSQEHFGRRGDVYNVFLEKHDSGWKIEYINRTRPITESVDEDTSLTMDIDNQDSSSNQEQEYEGKIYTTSNYPKNPKTPGEVFAVAIFLLQDCYLQRDCRCAELASLFDNSASAKMEEECLEYFEESDGIPDDQIVEKVIIEKVEIEGAKAMVTVSIVQGGVYTGPEEIKLIKEDGLWKILYQQD